MLLLLPSRRGFAHVLRDMLRMHQWSLIPRTRKDLGTVHTWEAGIDYQAATGALRQLSDAWHRGLLSNILTGALHTADRMVHTKTVPDALCQCGQKDGSAHLFLECPFHDKLRMPMLTMLGSPLLEQPVPFQTCGLLPQDPSLLRRQAALGGRHCSQPIQQAWSG